jgi:prepilin-type N-terminal cleavage/methylation domain-containing protein
MKFIDHNKMSLKIQKGFTLIELVLYVGIFSILMGVMATIFGQIVDVQSESQGVSYVDQDGKYILGKLVYDVKSLNVDDSLVTPANPGNQTTSLQLQINSINYTYSLNSNGNLIIRNVSTGETNVLNSANTAISGLSFQRLGAGGSNDTIRVSFTVSSRISQPSGPESRSFETTLARQ